MDFATASTESFADKISVGFFFFILFLSFHLQFDFFLLFFACRMFIFIQGDSYSQLTPSARCIQYGVLASNDPQPTHTNTHTPVSRRTLRSDPIFDRRARA